MSFATVERGSSPCRAGAAFMSQAMGPAAGCDWHCVALRDDLEGFAASDALSDCFIDEFVAAGAPTGMAVFVRHDTGSGFIMHWVSPAAHAVAELWHAVECEKPSPGQGLSLLLGDGDAWGALFPALRV